MCVVEVLFTDGNLIWDKAFKSGLSEFCGRQPLKNLKGYGLLKHTLSHLWIEKLSRN